MYKTILIFFISVFFFNHVNSQSWVWAKSFGGGNYNYTNSIKIDHSGNLVVAGIVEDTAIFGTDTLFMNGAPGMGFIAKFDPNGNAIWAKTFPTSNGTTFYPIFNFNVSICSDNNIVLTSHFRNTVIYGNDTLNEINGELFVAMLDSNGNFVWARNFGEVNQSGSNSVDFGRNTVDENDNIYMSGRFYQNFVFNGDTMHYLNGRFFLVKYDKHGNQKVGVQFGGRFPSGAIHDSHADQAGHVYITGLFMGGDSVHFGSQLFVEPLYRYYAFISKLDSAGNFIWTVKGGGITQYNGGGQILPGAMGLALANDPSGNIYCTGQFSDTVQFGNTMYYSVCGQYYCNNFFLAKYDANGNFQWLQYPSANSMFVFNTNGMDVECDSTGNIFVTGTFNDTIGFGNLINISSNPQRDLFFAKFNSSGTVQWLINTGTLSGWSDIALDCIADKLYFGSDYFLDPGILSSLGITYTSNQDILLGALSNAGICSSVSVNEIHQVGDESIFIFPNPAIGLVSINFMLEKNAYVKIEVFNSFGQKIKTVLNEKLKSGKQQIAFDATKFSEGIYFVKMDVDGEMTVRKMVKM